ncbi:FOG protein containing TPR repeat [Bacillus sp. JCM 19046]|nr:FOG protein containing TPR repeat [Bacillus sp. JCM 19046]
MAEIVVQAKSYQRNKQFEKAEQQLLQALEWEQNNGEVNYLLAANCDMQGLESQAVPYYTKAIELGLKEEDLKEAYVGLGSTYRTLGNYVESEKTLTEGLKRFPDYKPLHVFYSLTLYNLGNYDKAMERLLTSLLETTADPDIQGFKNALDYYAPRLNQVWT